MIRPLLELWRDGNRPVLTLCALGWVFDFFDLILFAFVQVQVGQDLGIDEGGLGWVHGATLGAAALGGLLFGRLADRRTRRSALVASIACYAVGAILTACAGDFWTLLAARVITGIGVGGEWGIGHTLVAESHPKHLRNRAAALLQALSPVALLFAAAVGLLVAPHVGWRACFLFGGAAPALLVLWARWSWRSWRREPVVAPQDEVQQVEVQPGRTATVSVRDLFAGPLRGRSTALLTVLILHMTGFWCVYSWMPKALFRDAGLDAVQVFWFFAAMNSMHVVADLGFGVLADRFGRGRTFVGFVLFYAAAQGAVALSLSGLWHDPFWLGVALAAMGLGAGTWSCFGVLFAEGYPPALRATAASTFYSAARGVQLPIQAAMPALFAWRGSYSVALEIGAVCALATLPLVRHLTGSDSAAAARD